MDNNQIPSFEIPKSAETTPAYSGGAEYDPSLSIEGTKEILPAPVAHAPSAVAGSGSNAVLPPMPQLPVAIQSSQTVDATSHIIADDVDVIEKEWVDRAKKIVAMTSSDPYVEAKEIGKLKATYMKKRFNKDLPVAEDGTR